MNPQDERRQALAALREVAQSAPALAAEVDPLLAAGEAFCDASDAAEAGEGESLSALAGMNRACRQIFRTLRWPVEGAEQRLRHAVALALDERLSQARLVLRPAGASYKMSTEDLAARVAL